MLVVLVVLVITYLYVTCKSIKYLSCNSKIPAARKAIALNIVLACVMFLLALGINLYSDDFKGIWQGIGLLNSLTFIHIINSFKEHPVKERSSGRGCEESC